MSRNPENVREQAHKYLEGGLANGGNSTHLAFKIQKEIGVAWAELVRREW